MNGMNGSMANGTAASSAKRDALRLSERKDALEAEMDVIIESLTRPNGPGLSGNLVDTEGFPRADIDIALVRQQRSRLAILKGDHKEVCTQLETMLRLALPPSDDADDDETVTTIDATPPVTEPQQEEATPAPAAQEQSNGTSAAPARDLRQAFAQVDEVTSASPASDAGLRVGDCIVAMGAVSLRGSPTPSHALGLLPGLLREHQNRAVDVVVHRRHERQQRTVSLQLTPRQWHGHGLLGCHIVPLEIQHEDPSYAPQVATATANRYYPASS